ncbi:ATP-grasp domain-containing protein [Kitasatospora sp. NPDC052896]|uniref:ATP-grasp domain-containing protein n=1 Tax=Kitasatospora sp. NPDC052896 TaxID=3364061 RepID=UPI0037C67F74
MTEHNPHLLVLSGWAGVVETALELGFDVSFVGNTTDFSPNELAVLERCRHVYPIPAQQVVACLRAARAIHREHPLHATVSFGEFGLESCAVIADALGIRGLPLASVAATRYKDRMRDILAGHPELALGWAPVASADDLEKFHAQYGLPLIVKPVAGSGSLGVRQITTPDELRAVLDDSRFWLQGSYLAEELVEGDELYSVETVTLNGRHAVAGMSLCRLARHPNVAITEVSVPPPAPYDRHTERISRTVLDFLDAIGHTWGLTHTEVKVAPDGRPVIIESQTRIGGYRIFRMVEHATGVDEIATVLRSLLPGGEQVTSPHLPPSSAVGMVVSLIPPRKRVRRTADPELLRAVEGVADFEIGIRPGEVPLPVAANTKRPGLIWLRVPDHAAAELTKREIARTYWVEFEDGDVWHPSF